jgi:SAM-dependent methyltransferase
LLQRRGLKVWAVTLSEDEAASARQYCEQVLVANVETDDLPFLDGFFDVLLLSHVLEHTVLPRTVLARLSRFLAPCGVVLVAVPNVANYRHRWRLLWGDWRMEESGAFDRTHLHFWSYHTAEETFAGTPFEIQKKIAGDPALPLWPLRRMLPRQLVQWIDACGGRLIPNLSAGQVILVGRKEPSARGNSACHNATDKREEG